jgi:type III pantothenate kinase
LSSGNIFLLDAGNSRIKWAMLTAAGLSETAHARYEETSLCDLTENVWAGLPSPSRILVANVAGAELAEKIKACARSLWTVQPEFIIADRQTCGVFNAYVTPHKLGADRWAALIGARHLVRGAICIVDCGTAITIDALNAEGQHLGGLILPGLHLMRRALMDNTSLAPLDRNEQVIAMHPFAKNTEHAVSNGILYAAMGALDRALHDISLTLPITTLFITGGDAHHVMPLLAQRYRYEPDLVLQGLAVIAQKGICQ